VTRDDIYELFEEIKQEYPFFDTGEENVERHYKYLQDFPFAAAFQNVVDHIKTNKFPPLISDIRGRLGDLHDSQKSKEEAASFFAQVELWKENCSPPPVGFMDLIRAKLGVSTE
jgi:Loader and inhibitor of phage G40P.